MDRDHNPCERGCPGRAVVIDVDLCELCRRGLCRTRR